MRTGCGDGPRDGSGSGSGRESSDPIVARLSGVIPRTAAALALASAAALSGCATFSQDDVVASFNDVELDQVEFEERYDAAGAARFDGRVLGDAARDVVTSWILQQVLAEAGLVELYEQGPEASNILCVSLVRTESLDAANGYVERLEQGEDWSELLAAEFPDVPGNGNVACVPTDTLGPLAPQVAGLSLAAPYAVFLFDDQSSAVLRMRPVAEVDPLELASIAQAIDPESVAGLNTVFEQAEITVAPQFGRFDADAGGVVPLG